jgi:drug/metabolite transporter (DMT)-like permease
MFKYYAAAALSIILTALSQLLLKVGVGRAVRRSPLWIFINPISLAAYGLLLGVTLLTLYAYQRLPLKLAVLFQPFNYILIGLFSCLFLKERLTRPAACDPHCRAAVR